jgi:hypothetical protein
VSAVHKDKAQQEIIWLRLGGSAKARFEGALRGPNKSRLAQARAAEDRYGRGSGQRWAHGKRKALA